MSTQKKRANSTEQIFISPKELANRWRCARSSADRITRQAGLTRFYLGDGRNGMVRFILKEVEEYEQQRRVELRP